LLSLKKKISSSKANYCPYAANAITLDVLRHSTSSYFSHVGGAKRLLNKAQCSLKTECNTTATAAAAWAAILIQKLEHLINTHALITYVFKAAVPRNLAKFSR